MNVGKTTIRNNEIRNNAPVPSSFYSFAAASQPGGHWPQSQYIHDLQQSTSEYATHIFRSQYRRHQSEYLGPFQAKVQNPVHIWSRFCCFLWVGGVGFSHLRELASYLLEFANRPSSCKKMTKALPNISEATSGKPLVVINEKNMR